MFLEDNVPPAYDMARRVQVADSDKPMPSASKTYKEIASAYRRDIISLEQSMEDLRRDTRALARRGQDLSSQLTTAQEQLERVRAELDRAQKQVRHS